MLVSRFPYPLDKGDKLRAFHQLKELNKHFDVTLVALSSRSIPDKEREIVEAHCSHLVIHKQNRFSQLINIFLSLINNEPLQVGYFFNRKVKREIKELIQQNDFKHIYCQLLRTAKYIDDEFHIPKTLDYQDAFSAGIERRISAQPFYSRWLFKLEAKRLRSYEGRLFDFFDLKTMISEQDKQLILHPQMKEIKCIPNGIDPSFFKEIPGNQSYDFVFVGNMSYPPNIEAVAYIEEFILPKFPESKLLISGANPSQKVKRIAESSGQVELTGWVDDIRTSYAKGHIFLAPMMIGTGMQNKLLEAMAMGIPCVTTSLANNAIQGTHQQEIMVAETPEEFVKAIQELNENTDLYNSLKENARKFVSERYSWKITTGKLIQEMEKHMANGH